MGGPQYVDFRGGTSQKPLKPPWALGSGGPTELGRGLERRLSAGGERDAAAAMKLERRSLSARLERRLSVGHLYASRSSIDPNVNSGMLQGGSLGAYPEQKPPAVSSGLLGCNEAG